MIKSFDNVIGALNDFDFTDVVLVVVVKL